MSTLDTLRRECEDLGTAISKAGDSIMLPPQGNAIVGKSVPIKKGAREAIGKLQARAMLVGPSDSGIDGMAKELAEIRSKYEIPAAVAASYRA